MADTALDVLELTGKDTLHIYIRMVQDIAIKDNQVVETFRPLFPYGDGSISAYNPTTWHFMIVKNNESGGLELDSDWVFEPFKLGTESCNGIMVTGCGYKAEFGKTAQHIILNNFGAQRGCAQKYSMLFRNVKTGELIALDPGVEDKDRPGQAGG